MLLLVFLYTWLLSQKFGSIEGTIEFGSIELNVVVFLGTLYSLILTFRYMLKTTNFGFY